jgi:hypothetical protein
MDKEQLEALRRQVEEDYKLDIAAIERLLRRHSTASSSTSVSASDSSASLSTYSAPSRRAEAESRIEQGRGEGDDLAGSIRTMFGGNGRK